MGSGGCLRLRDVGGSAGGVVRLGRQKVRWAKRAFPEAKRLLQRVHHFGAPGVVLEPADGLCVLAVW